MSLNTVSWINHWLLLSIKLLDAFVFVGVMYDLYFMCIADLHMALLSWFDFLKKTSNCCLLEVLLCFLEMKNVLFDLVIMIKFSFPCFIRFVWFKISFSFDNSSTLILCSIGCIWWHKNWCLSAPEINMIRYDVPIRPCGALENEVCVRVIDFLGYIGIRNLEWSWTVFKSWKEERDIIHG